LEGDPHEQESVRVHGGLMIEQRKVITVLIGGLVLCATIHADMMPAPRQDSGYTQSLSVCDRAVLQHTSWPSPFDGPGVTDLDSLPVTFLPISSDDGEQTREAKPVPVLTDGQSSFSLCLYALLGLGLCRSASFVKKLHFDCIPEWYQCGGPSQIGHSFAISPDCLTSTQVFCFIQPNGTSGIEDSPPQYHGGTVTSLWWKSQQFTPTALASRGPPNMSQRDRLPLFLGVGAIIG
jgi:hypothetical protein